MLSHLKIGPRLGIGFAVVLVAFVALWTLASINIRHARDLSTSITQRHDQTGALSQAHGAIWALRGHLAQAFATPDAAARQQIAEQATATRKQFDAGMFNYKQAADLSSEEEAMMRELVAAFGRYHEARVKWFELLGAGNADDVQKFRAETLEPAGALALAAVQKLMEVQDKLVARADDYYVLELNRSQWFIHLVGVLALAGAAVVIWLLARSITGPLHAAVASVESVARGDLSRPIVVRSQDEVGQLLQALEGMQTNLTGLVGEVISGARAVADSSAQIAQGNLDLSQRTEEQASTLEETASSMEQLTATVDQNAQNARQARELAAGASLVAVKGGEVVGEVVRTMTDISESSRRVADIIGVIDGIAFQTNILALNAAVEAARAGEQGRGFAVVAAEVRNLAQRSASAAKEIKALIVGSVGQVEAGTKLVHDAGLTMQEIVDAVKKVSDLVAEIASASQEQSAGIGQVSTAVTQMDQVVQQNASLVEEATAATESMKEQAAALVRTVSNFKLRAEAAPTAARAEPARSAGARPAPVRVTRSTQPPHEPAHAAAVRLAVLQGGGAPKGDWKEF